MTQIITRAPNVERVLDLTPDYPPERLAVAAELLQSSEALHLNCRYWQDLAPWVVGPRTVPDTFLLVPTVGGFRVETRGRRWDVRPGHALLLADDEPHRLSILPELDVLEQVAVHGHVWDAYRLPVARLFAEPVMALPSADWLARLRDLAALESAAPEAAAVLGATLLPALFAEWVLAGVPVNRDQDGGDPRVLDTLLHIRDHLADDLDVATLARRVGLAPGRLRALFHDHLAMSPKQYIVTARLRRAARLLRRSRRQVKAVAADVGFANPAYFIRRFRQHYGQTPAAFRRGGGEL